MKIKLSQPFAPNSAAVPFDVLQVKKGLNRLAYYTPLATTGITDIADTAVFSALKKFQKDFGLAVTGIMNPDDATLRLLNLEIAKTPKGHYIWRTVGDDRVRPSHAVLDNSIRSWNESPNPSEDFGCRCWAERLKSTAESRKDAMLGKGNADFELKPDLKPVTEKPFYALDTFSDVNKFKLIIDEESEKAGVNSNLIKAIVYIETSQGWYDRLNPSKSSIRPMNIQTEYWKELGYTREQLETPRLNIRAGVDLIKRIQLNYPQGTVEEIATLYNDLAAKRINDYGGRVKRLTQEQPWLKEK